METGDLELCPKYDRMGSFYEYLYRMRRPGARVIEDGLRKHEYQRSYEDHTWHGRDEKGNLVFVTEPYHLTDEAMRELVADCEKWDLSVTVWRPQTPRWNDSVTPVTVSLPWKERESRPEAA